MKVELVSKQELNETEMEGVLLLNGDIELTFYKWLDGDASSISVYLDDELLGDEVEDVDGIDAWDIVDAAIDVIG
jgi:hypothetical protein